MLRQPDCHHYHDTHHGLALSRFDAVLLQALARFLIKQVHQLRIRSDVDLLAGSGIDPLSENAYQVRVAQPGENLSLRSGRLHDTNLYRNAVAVIEQEVFRADPIDDGTAS